jgi:16S rRNA processing protein RimM
LSSKFLTTDAATDARADAGSDSGTVEVGSVVRAHGVRGDVLVYPLSDLAERFAAGSQLWLTGRDGTRRAVTVRASARQAPEKLVVAFEGVDDRDAAEALRGARLEVAREAVPEAPAGTYWQFELLGCRAFDERAGELGEVVEVTDAGGGPLLVVALADGRRVPLPFVDRLLVGVDLAARRIDWRLPEGLIEACASRS